MYKDNRTILAIDTDPGTRMLLEVTLNCEGYRATVVGDPDQAFELLDIFPAIIVFDDVTFGPTLPDFVASARSIEPHPDMIFMSTDRNASTTARTLGVRSSIVKPFDPTKLFKLVTECPRFTASGTQIAAPAIQLPEQANRSGLPRASRRRA